MMKSWWVLMMVVTWALLLWWCSTAPQEVVVQEPIVVVPKEAPIQEPAVETNTIVDVVVATPEVSILKDIVIELGLVETLSSEWPFTVFAPTNDAFVSLLETLWMTYDELVEQRELLQAVVLYHVIWSEVSAEAASSLPEWTLVETLWGESIRVSNMNGVEIDESKVITADIDVSNGVIHLIDEVLLPPTVRETLWMTTDRWEENIVDTAVSVWDFPTLIAAVQAAWLVDTLSWEWPFTVFAPTEEAFAALLAALEITAEELLADTELLTQVLLYHTVSWFYTASDIAASTDPVILETVQGDEIILTMTDLWAMVNESNIVLADVFASNGVIHVIDAVLVPNM